MKTWIITKIIGTGKTEDLKRPYTAGQTVPTSMIELENNDCLCRVSGMPAQIATIKADAAITVLTDDEARKLQKAKWLYQLAQKMNEELIPFLTQHPDGEEINSLVEQAKGKTIDDIISYGLWSSVKWTDIEHLDSSDPEIEEIMKSLGLNPTELKKDIVTLSEHKRIKWMQTLSVGSEEEVRQRVFPAMLQETEKYLLSLISTKQKFTKEWWDKEAKNGKWATGKELEDGVKDGRGEACEYILSRMRMKHLKITCSCDKPSKIAHDITCLEVPDIPLEYRKELPLEAAQAQGYLPCPICKPFI